MLWALICWLLLLILCLMSVAIGSAELVCLTFCLMLPFGKYQLQSGAFLLCFCMKRRYLTLQIGCRVCENCEKEQIVK